MWNTFAHYIDMKHSVHQKVSQKFEILLHFRKTLKGEKIIFGDFNIDTLEEHKGKTDYTNLLSACDFKVSIRFTDQSYADIENMSWSHD